MTTEKQHEPFRCLCDDAPGDNSLCPVHGTGVECTCTSEGFIEPGCPRHMPESHGIGSVPMLTVRCDQREWLESMRDGAGHTSGPYREVYDLVLNRFFGVPLP